MGGRVRFGGHQSFHLRDQWLHKGLLSVRKCPNILSVKKIENAMHELGVGKNMVYSIRDWLRALRLI